MPPPKKHPAKTEEDPLRVKAGATKELFIYMLVRDLVLRDAIGDLVDNSIDAVRRVVNGQADAPSEFALQSDKYKGYHLNLDFDKDKFVIEDNCGGMEVETAREYAFRFGRDPHAPPTPGSIGQFGIGMKRALFKLGHHFHITSRAANSSFELTIDVEKWLKSPTWDFKLDSFTETPTVRPEDRGMRIVVTKLNPDISEIFENSAQSLFESKLNKEIGNENLFNINNGFVIRLNGNKLKPRQLEMLTAPELKAGNFSETYTEYDERGRKAKVQVRILTGIGEAKLADGGWYIFCNERLVLGPSQDSISGWTGKGAGGGPKYHGQYERFRGYVFFSSDNASVLPWNTTKTSMDMDSKLYQAVRQVMIRMMEPVNSFLSDMKTEREKDNPVRPLAAALDMARLVPILAIGAAEQAPQFTAPEPAKAADKPPGNQLIKYYVPVERFEMAKRALRVRKNDEVGPQTFDYFYRNEVE